MTTGRRMRRIVLPQAMRVIVPPTGNEFINMLKTSVAGAVVQYGSCCSAAQDISAATPRRMEMLFVAAIWYLVDDQRLQRRPVLPGAPLRHAARTRQLPATPLQRMRRIVFAVSRGGTGPDGRERGDRR